MLEKGLGDGPGRKPHFRLEEHGYCIAQLTPGCTQETAGMTMLSPLNEGASSPLGREPSTSNSRVTLSSLETHASLFFRNCASPTDNTSSKIRISGFTTVAIENPSLARIPEE